jgi:uncharacterized protein YecE (DUF72 family)
MVRFGTCSWKYDSWRGIIYPETGKFNYLEEYAKYYNTVEIDQWFWSLFSEVVLPIPSAAKNYAECVPDDFLFTIKVPNSLTLTHYYKTDKKNPFFLSVDLFEQFLNSIEPLVRKTGSLIFQFEYLNKQKMTSVQQFMECLRKFFEAIPADSPPISVEIRNPYYLTENWFRFLSEMKVSHVFLEGYFMPLVTETYRKYQNQIGGNPVIRLHGPDRSGIEEMSGGEWSKIYINRDDYINPIADLIINLQNRVSMLYVNVNNHYEGCAPLTIKKLEENIKNQEKF